ncbi:MAG: thermonuclease family protein [Planctomycetota bacterium]
MADHQHRANRFRRPVFGPARLLIFFVGFIALWNWWLSNKHAAPEVLREGVHRVRYVVDGDTLVLESGARVRLQGVDTPEVAHHGRPAEPLGGEASRFAESFVQRSDRRVRLSFSVERRDHYGRFLAFVWHGDAMLNEELVRNGLARARPDYRFSGRMRKRLLAAQEAAVEAEVGLWSPALRGNNNGS